MELKLKLKEVLESFCKSFNQTNVELKRSFLPDSVRLLLPFNQTNVELKRIINGIWIIIAPAFNQTNVELKHDKSKALYQ